MPKSLKTRIINNLEETGFPLEVAISLDLDKRNWQVYPGALYKDPETLISREIDIHTLKVDLSLSNKAPTKTTLSDANKFISHLVIQCRKADKPWVFFDNGRLSWPRIPPQNFKSDREEFHGLFLHDLKAAGRKVGPSLETFGLRKHRYIQATFHKSHHEAFSQKGGNQSKIYESLITVSKALDYFKNRYGIGRHSIHLFIPMIVIDGTLWGASILKSRRANRDKVALKEVERLFAIFSRLIPSDTREFEEEQVIEIVTRKGFIRHLREVEENNKDLYQCWTSFINSTRRPRRVS